MSNCSSCGAPVLWLAHERTGVLSPIDVEPLQFGGNLEALPDPETGEITKYRVILKGEPGPQLRHKSHFATCPTAKRHRKAKLRG